MVLFIFRLLPQEDLATVSLVNKKFRNLSRDDRLWRELTLDYQDIKQSAGSYRKLLERSKKLSSLTITNKSRNSGSFNTMSVVIRSKKSLQILEMGRMWTGGRMRMLLRKNLAKLQK